MIWPAAALALLVLGFVVGYASVLQSRLQVGSGDPVDEEPADGLEAQRTRPSPGDVASAGGIV